MEISPDLKPLYANLKRLGIGSYLCTKEFELYSIENDIDQAWGEVINEISKKRSPSTTKSYDMEDYEEALGVTISGWYGWDRASFVEEFVPLFLDFIQWSKVRVDFLPVYKNLKDLEVMSSRDLLDFAEKARKFRLNKPEKLSVTEVQATEVEYLLDERKVFIVHGHDDKSRLELSSLLQTEFGLKPVVLQEQPNDSVETIISKFERLAKDCGMAIILMTSDDITEQNARARQNVVFELGYFLGKFHKVKQRRIVVIKNGNIEIPSDISGVLYLEFHKSVKELFLDLKIQFEHWKLLSSSLS